MKKNDFLEIKNLDAKTLMDRARIIRGELADLRVEKGINKLTDLKVITKKRKDLAKILTVVNQKRLIEKLESQVKKQDKTEDIKKQTEPIKPKITKAKKGDKK